MVCILLNRRDQVQPGVVFTQRLFVLSKGADSAYAPALQRGLLRAYRLKIIELDKDVRGDPIRDILKQLHVLQFGPSCLSRATLSSLPPLVFGVIHEVVLIAVRIPIETQVL